MTFGLLTLSSWPSDLDPCDPDDQSQCDRVLHTHILFISVPVLSPLCCTYCLFTLCCPRHSGCHLYNILYTVLVSSCLQCFNKSFLSTLKKVLDCLYKLKCKVKTLFSCFVFCILYVFVFFFKSTPFILTFPNKVLTGYTRVIKCVVGR